MMSRFLTLLLVALVLVPLSVRSACGQGQLPREAPTFRAAEDPEPGDDNRAAIMTQIEFLEREIEKLQHDVGEWEKLAADAEAHQMYVAASNYRDLARDYRARIREYRQEISELRRKLASLDRS